MSDWVTANKGQGPWAFQEQPQKVGYVNNPRWTGAPASVLEHEPCGYWLKGSETSREEYGLLWGTGNGSSGLFGTGGGPIINSWANINSDPQFSHIVWSGITSASVRRDGSLYVSGINTSGQLGLGDTISRSVWTKVSGLTNVKQVAVSSIFSVALKHDGTLWSAGSNLYGQLGQGDYTQRNVFTQIGTASNWVRVACGAFHTLALNSLGELWGCGAEAITTPYTWNALGLGATGFPHLRQTLTLLASDVLSMSGSSEATAIVKTNGTLHTTGYNQSGHLGVGDLAHRLSFTPEVTAGGNWTDVSMGYDHAGGIRSDGTLWLTGENGSGQLGLGDTTDRSVFTQVGTGVDWGRVNALFMHTLAIKRNGTLWAVGRNTQGELGLGDNSDRSSFVQVGTAKDWLRLNESASYVSGEVSLAIRKALEIITITGVQGANPVWPMPA
jgi:alpha-tubulin suppressor-like RCC1 family protein